jgi:putative ABC transport system permease protein
MLLVLWNLRHHRRRHVLNMLVIAITTAVIIVFTSVLTQLIRESRRARDAVEARISIETKLGSDEVALPLAMERVLREIDGVNDVEAYAFMGGGTADVGFVMHAVTESWAKHPDPLFHVDPAGRAAWLRDAPDGVIVTPDAAEHWRLQPGKVAELPMEFGPLQVKVSAIGPKKNFMMIVCHFKYLQERLTNPGYASFRVYAKPSDFAKVAQALEDRLAQAGYHVVVTNDAQLLLTLVEQAASIPMFFGFLGLFLIITAGLTLANNNAISIRERRAQIAALRVIGFKNRTLLWSILAEVVIIGMLSAAVTVVALRACFPSGLTLGNENSIVAKTPIGAVAIAIGIATSILVPVIGALPSALLSLRTPLAKALRDAA